MKFPSSVAAGHQDICSIPCTELKVGFAKWGHLQLCSE